MYLCVGCAWMAGVTWAPAWYGSEKDPRHDGVFFDFVLCLALCFAVGLLFMFHTYLILSAQTTIEFYQNRVAIMVARRQGKTFENPYDLGYRRNWQAVFGSSRWWFLPVVRAPPTDGISWPINPKAID